MNDFCSKNCAGLFNICIWAAKIELDVAAPTHQLDVFAHFKDSFIRFNLSRIRSTSVRGISCPNG
jgi:hypothetical protein